MQLSDLQELSPTTIAIAAVVLLLTVIYILRKRSGVLPGPTGVPILGLFPFLNFDTGHLQLMDYGKKYGDIFSFTYTGKLFIHMGSVKVTKDLHVNKSECFAERSETFNALNAMLPESVVMANGESWKTLKKFFNHKFREYGVNSLREGLAGPIYDSLDALMKDLQDTSDRPVNTVELLTKRCTVSLRRIIFGDNGISDEDIDALNSGYGESLNGMIGMSLLLMGPIGRFLFTISPAARKAMKANHRIRHILQKCAEKMESEMNEDSPTCIIEDFFKERNEKRRQNDPTWKYYSDIALISTLVQFVGDGIAGVASFISAVLYTLIEHPEEQDKIYDEIMEVIGSRQMTLEDKSRLPYTNAFFNEAIRTSYVVPLMPSLECTKETTYRGYIIPKGAITVYNFWAIHHNPDTFEDPDTFNPSRYMAAPGKSKAELPTTFGMGKRSCTGEAFVMAQTFIFVTAIIRKFKVVASNDPKYSIADFILSGKLELQFQPRDEK